MLWRQTPRYLFSDDVSTDSVSPSRLAPLVFVPWTGTSLARTGLAVLLLLDDIGSWNAPLDRDLVMDLVLERPEDRECPLDLGRPLCCCVESCWVCFVSPPPDVGGRVSVSQGVCRSFPSSSPYHVRDLIPVSAHFVCCHVRTIAQLALRNTLVLLVRVRCAAAPTDDFARVGAHIGPVTQSATYIAVVHLLSIQKASHQHWSVAHKVRNFPAIECHNN
ncbi:hypothetical protein MTO96_033764 [Rhipicephalus appendiculatus]